MTRNAIDRMTSKRTVLVLVLAAASGLRSP
jgi:hypothetical protein